jgi:hypothetical protein
MLPTSLTLLLTPTAPAPVGDRLVSSDRLRCHIDETFGHAREEIS